MLLWHKDYFEQLRSNWVGAERNKAPCPPPGFLKVGQKFSKVAPLPTLPGRTKGNHPGQPVFNVRPLAAWRGHERNLLNKLLTDFCIPLVSYLPTGCCPWKTNHFSLTSLQIYFSLVKTLYKVALNSKPPLWVTSSRNFSHDCMRCAC